MNLFLNFSFFKVSLIKEPPQHNPHSRSVNDCLFLTKLKSAYGFKICTTLLFMLLIFLFFLIILSPVDGFKIKTALGFEVVSSGDLEKLIWLVNCIRSCSYLIRFCS